MVYAAFMSAYEPASTKPMNRLVGLPAFRAFRRRNFTLLFFNTVSFWAGQFMLMIAVGWQVLVMTNSPFLLSLVWVARYLPFFLFGMFTGAIADRVNRRRLILVMVSLISVCAFLIGLIISSREASLILIYGIVFIMSTLSAFVIPTRQALIVDIVGPLEAMSAISLNSMAQRAMGILGGLTAGLAIESLGMAHCLHLIAVFFVLGLFPLMAMNDREVRTGSSSTTFQRGVVEGLKIIRFNQAVILLVIMGVSCEIFGFSFQSQLPVFARDILEKGAFGLGFLGAMQSLGAMIGVFVLASLGDFSRKGLLILVIFLFYGVFLILFSQSALFPVSLVMVMMVGGMASTFDCLQQTLLQLNVLEEQRGRAMGIWLLCIGFGPLGAALTGAVAARFGAPAAITINGSAIILIFALLMTLAPRLKRL